MLFNIIIFNIIIIFKEHTSIKQTSFKNINIIFLIVQIDCTIITLQYNILEIKI